MSEAATCHIVVEETDHEGQQIVYLGTGLADARAWLIKYRESGQADGDRHIIYVWKSGAEKPLTQEVYEMPKEMRRRWGIRTWTSNTT